jgi:hypothetical protein
MPYEIIHGNLNPKKPMPDDLPGWPGKWLIKTGMDGMRTLVVRDGRHPVTGKPDETQGLALTFDSKEAAERGLIAHKERMGIADAPEKPKRKAGRPPKERAE